MNEKICGYKLDEEQQKIVLDESKHLLVTAGAGSGKTLTILGKINYLLKYKNIKQDEILCISFTNASSKNLEEKIAKNLNLKISVYTFHKLSLEILKDKKIFYDITPSDTLENIIHEFLYITILDYENYMILVSKYLKFKYKNREEYINYLEKNYEKVKIFENLISTFIRLLKCNGYNILSFNDFLIKARKNIFHYKKEKVFLTLVLNIYLIYEQYLKENNEFDFDDMIINATNIIDNSINKKWKYIIIDEYQDTSYIRFLLIKKILDVTNSSLMVVGDDFQSIYKFTGCDLSIFLDFKNYFDDAKIMKITNTYRNSQQLIKIAGDFVMKNKKQIKKNLKSLKDLDNPVQIIYYKNIKNSFLRLILEIYNKTNQQILVLGRNNNDINNVLNKKYFKYKNNKIIYLENPKIDIEYLTVHKSKGLESDNVIIINLENKFLGFPNKIKDDKILKYVTPNKSKFPYEEERRLFYVALTRTKNKVYLFTPYKNESIFINELKKYKNVKIKYL